MRERRPSLRWESASIGALKRLMEESSDTYLPTYSRKVVLQKEDEEDYIKPVVHD